MNSKLIYFTLIILAIILSGCQSTIPKEALSLSPDSLQKRETQSRYFETSDSDLILSAAAGVLQDLGFTIDKSESQLGFLVGSKERDAMEVGQVAAAIMVAVLFGAEMPVDKHQKIRVSITINPSLEGNKTHVRAKFQRIVWNNRNQVSKLETISNSEIYQEFFDRLSKSVFLEANKI